MQGTHSVCNAACQYFKRHAPEPHSRRYEQYTCTCSPTFTVFLSLTNSTKKLKFHIIKHSMRNVVLVKYYNAIFTIVLGPTTRGLTLVTPCDNGGDLLVPALFATLRRFAAPISTCQISNWQSYQNIAVHFVFADLPFLAEILGRRPPPLPPQARRLCTECKNIIDKYIKK